MIRSISITLQRQRTADRCQGLQGQPAPADFRREFAQGLRAEFDIPVSVDFTDRPREHMMRIACDGGSNAEIKAALTKMVAVLQSVERRHNVRGGVS